MNTKLFTTVLCLLLFAANAQAQHVSQSVRVTQYQQIVIPAQAGIQTEDVNPVYLDPRLRGGDGNVTVGLRAPGEFTVDHSEMYLPPPMYLPPFGAPTDWTPPPPQSPEELLQMQQMQELGEQVNAGMERAMMRGVSRAIWNGQAANLMTFFSITEHPGTADALGISVEQFTPIFERVMPLMEQMENPEVAFGHNIMAELGMADPTVIPDNRALPDVETVMTMQIEMMNVMENTVEQMGTLMNTAIADAFDEFLTPEQLRMIQESQLANIGELSVFSPSIFEALDLTEAQRVQMEQIRKELEPDFEEALDSWVDGFLAIQKRVDEEWNREREARGLVLTRVDDEGVINVAVVYPGSDYGGEEWIAMESDEHMVEFLNDFTSQAICHDDIRKRLLAEDQMFRQIYDEMQSKSKEFAERFKNEMFDVLTDEQWTRLQELIAHPPEHALAFRKALREMLNLGESEEIAGAASGKIDTESGVWVPGPGSWRPGDAMPVRIQEQRRSRFPRGEE